MNANALDKLENQIAMLIRHCQQLEQENSSLRNQLKTLQDERKQLVQVNNLTGQKVDAMITRLKSLEQQA